MNESPTLSAVHPRTSAAHSCYLALWAAVVASVCIAGLACRNGSRSASLIQHHPRWRHDHAGIVRGDTSVRVLALIFTGGDYGEGCEHILSTLESHGIKASFFLTGAFLSQPERRSCVRRMVGQGHYVGPHSHAHLLYSPWEDRSKSLVGRRLFRQDLRQNLRELRALGALRHAKVVYFIPPYEWYNEDHVRWANEMGVVLCNFTPGSGSHRDWIPEGEKGFVPGTAILQDILAYEQQDPNGLNGFLLLLHLGAQRQDKVFLQLGPLVEELLRRGYRFVRIDELLAIP
ncbi:MAG: polysaccharide deacetylase family protein [Calditrichaeota bacterium]|nr:polysaccharide deacetylase family protein [Calditrichota bacterium]